MKKIFGLLIFIMFLTSCDDGDIVLESFDFDNVAIQKCPDKEVLFKINNSEMLLIDIPAASFVNEVTPVDQPRIVEINDINKVLYRKYTATVTTSSICSDIPPASPSVQKEWNASNGGEVQIITTEKFTTDPTTNEQVLTGYNHQIKLINVQFVNPSDTFVFEEYLVGTYTTGL